jgi:hypothetical protein
MPRPDRLSDAVARTVGLAGLADAVHPLQGGAPHVRFRQQAVPLPPIAEIPAGFDAILQFRSDDLDRRLAAHLAEHVGPLHAFFQVEADALPASVRDEIARRILAATAASIVLDPATGLGSPAGGLDVDLERYALRVSAEAPRVLLLPLPVARRLEPIEPSIRWALRVDVGIPEVSPGAPPVPPRTGIGAGAGPAPPGPGRTPTVPGGTAVTVPPGSPGDQPPATGGLRYVPLAQGRGLTPARLERGEHAARYELWARLHLADGDVALESGDVVFQALRPHGLTGAVDAALAPVTSHPDLAITPVMALGGLLRQGERLRGVQSFRVSMVATPGNSREFQVLSLCANLGPAAEAGDLGLVRPFVGDRPYGYCASLEVIRAVIGLRWARADTPKTVVADGPVELLLKDGSEVSATARVRFTFVDSPAIDFAPGEWGVPDAIRLAGMHDIEVLELRGAGEVVRGNDLGDLRGPERHPYAIRIHPLDERTPPGGPARAFLDDLGRRLMEALYRPTARSFRLRRLAGQTSAAVRALVLTGELS